MYSFAVSREGVENVMYFIRPSGLSRWKGEVDLGKATKRPQINKPTVTSTSMYMYLFLHLRAVFVNNARKLVHSLKHYAASYGKA